MNAVKFSRKGGSQKMTDINEFTFWKASCVQNPKNCTYPTKAIVTAADSFNKMAHFDHVTAEYENCYRSNDTFLNSDVQSGDVDNDNVGNPEEWITKRISIRCLSVFPTSYRKARTM